MKIAVFKYKQEIQELLSILYVLDVRSQPLLCAELYVVLGFVFQGPVCK